MRRVKPSNPSSEFPSTAGSNWSSMVLGSPVMAACSHVASWTTPLGLTTMAASTLRGCGLPPDARRHATNEQLCGFGRVSGTGRSRPPRHGPDLARPGAHRLRRRPPARLSAHGIDGIRGLRVDQAGPILRRGGRRASGPLRLQPFEPRPRGLHHPSGAGRLGRAKLGHAVLHLGRRYDRPDHTSTA